MRLKSIGTVGFARAMLTISIKALFFKMVQSAVVVETQLQHSVTTIRFLQAFLKVLSEVCTIGRYCYHGLATTIASVILFWKIALAEEAPVFFKIHYR